MIINCSRKILSFFLMCLFLMVGLSAQTEKTVDVGKESPIIVPIDNSKGAKSDVTLLESDENGITIQCTVAAVNFFDISQKEGNFILPRISGFSRSFNVGEPNLPVAGKLIQIPFGCTLSTKILAEETVEVKLSDYRLSAPVMPVQPGLFKHIDPSTVKFEYKKDLYEKAGNYALPLANTEIIGTMRSMRLARLAIAPVQYDPVSKSIKVYKNLTVRVNFKDADWALTSSMEKKYSSFLFDGIKNQVLNPELVNSLDDTKADLVTYPTKYLIISDRMFETQLAPFIAWKTKKGFTVVVGYTDTIGTTTTAIKNYIQGLYTAGTPTDPAPSFVLFVGDMQQIPSYSYPSPFGGNFYSDLTYCEFTGDSIPEMYYGRFSAQNTTALQPQIDKTLQYEQFTMPDASYMANHTLVVGVDDTHATTYGDPVVNYASGIYCNAAHGIVATVWHYADSILAGAPAAFRQTVADGAGFFYYTGHGGHLGPSTQTAYVFTTSQILLLNNVDKYLLGIGNCCVTNTFGTDYTNNCFGETWLQAANEGGIGWIGSTANTMWDEDYWWAIGNTGAILPAPTYATTGIGAFDGIFHDHGEPVTQHYTTNGAIIFCGNSSVTAAGSTYATYYWRMYHLMGDPSVMTYMGVPSTNAVSHPATVSTVTTSILVNADPGSYVGISLGGVLHGAGYIGTSGSNIINITPFGVVGTADIVVTCQNKIPYTGTIVISPVTPPTSDFIGTPLTGTAPLLVNFTNLSTGGTNWLWTFGDGSTSSLENPLTHTYTSPGFYTVKLTTTNLVGSDTEKKINYIHIPVTGQDLWVSDGLHDIGFNSYDYDSTDIWVTQTPSQTEHYDPVSGMNNLVNVRVSNVGNTAIPTSTLKVYWGDVSTANIWPTDFHQIGSTITVPALAAGASYSHQWTWYVDPAIGLGHHFCLVAVADSTVDPANPPAGWCYPAPHDNNIGQKNITIVTAPGAPYAKTRFMLQNNSNRSQTFNLVARWGESNTATRNNGVTLFFPDSLRSFVDNQNTKLQGFKRVSVDGMSNTGLKVSEDKGGGTIFDIPLAPGKNVVVEVMLETKETEPGKMTELFLHEEADGKHIGGLTLRLLQVDPADCDWVGREAVEVFADFNFRFKDVNADSLRKIFAEGVFRNFCQEDSILKSTLGEALDLQKQMMDKLLSMAQPDTSAKLKSAMDKLELALQKGDIKAALKAEGEFTQAVKELL